MVARATFTRTYDGPSVVSPSDQTEDSDGDRRRRREGWPAGEAGLPAPGKVADAIARTSQPKRQRVERQ